MSDYLSRDLFDANNQLDSEALAKEAFQRMDIHLDLRIERIDTEEDWTKRTITRNGKKNGKP